MKHVQAGAVVGVVILVAGIVWNLLGEYAAVIIALAAIVTTVVAIIDWLTEPKEA